MAPINHQKKGPQNPTAPLLLSYSYSSICKYSPPKEVYFPIQNILL